MPFCRYGCAASPTTSHKAEDHDKCMNIKRGLRAGGLKGIKLRIFKEIRCLSTDKPCDFMVPKLDFTCSFKVVLNNYTEGSFKWSKFDRNAHKLDWDRHPEYEAAHQEDPLAQSHSVTQSKA